MYCDTPPQWYVCGAHAQAGKGLSWSSPLGAVIPRLWCLQSLGVGVLSEGFGEIENEIDNLDKLEAGGAKSMFLATLASPVSLAGQWLQCQGYGPGRLTYLLYVSTASTCRVMASTAAVSGRPVLACCLTGGGGDMNMRSAQGGLRCGA